MSKNNPEKYELFNIIDLRSRKTRTANTFFRLRVSQSTQGYFTHLKHTILNTA